MTSNPAYSGAWERSAGDEPELADQRLRRAVVASVGAVFQPGNRVTILRNGVEIFPSMLEAIQEARKSIEFVTFIYWQGEIAREFASALSDRASAGVRVRVLLDAFGSLPMNQDLVEQMKASGVEVEKFRPLVRWKLWESDHRTHRKVLVVDNRVGFTGGVGIAEEWEGDANDPSEWRDTHFRIEGPVVTSLRSTFLTDWRDTGHPITDSDIDVEIPGSVGDVEVALIDGSAQIGFDDAERVLEAMVSAATDRILIQTPYFNPSDELMQLMEGALERGVEIDVLLPGPHIDKRISAVMAEEMYARIVASGARVSIYQRTMMHVKAVMVDGVLSLVGSINVNRRSTEKDEEVALAILDEGITARLEQQFAEDLESSQAAAPKDRRPFARRLMAKLLRPLSHEM